MGMCPCLRLYDGLLLECDLASIWVPVDHQEELYPASTQARRTIAVCNYDDKCQKPLCEKHLGEATCHHGSAMPDAPIL